MTDNVEPFVLRRATVVVDTPDDADIVQRCLGMPAVVQGQIPPGGLAKNGMVLVVSAKGAHAKLAQLLAAGIPPEHGRFVDLEGELPLGDLVAYNIERLRWRFKTAGDIHHDKVRLLSQWETRPAFEPWLTGDEIWDGLLRWRPRAFCVVVGAYGSGKSTIAQLLAAKLLRGPALAGTDARMSVCAWEDDIEDYRDRLGRFACGGDPLATADGPARAHAAQDRVYWFEPDADNERLLDNYLANITYLTKHKGVRIHVCDPWNAFNHDFSSERETMYVRRVLSEMQRMTRDLDCTIIMATHLPKASYGDEGKLKAFRIANAAGSVEFGNKADYGLCISRTRSIANALAGNATEQWLSANGLISADIDVAREKGRAIVGRDIDGHTIFAQEHAVVTVDKVKIEGFSGRGMGRKGLALFAVDRERGDLVFDPAATELAKQVMR